MIFGITPEIFKNKERKIFDDDVTPNSMVANQSPDIEKSSQRSLAFKKEINLVGSEKGSEKDDDDEAMKNLKKMML